MSSEMYQRMRSNPKFQELVRRRSRFATVMSIAVLGLFYGYFLLVALKPGALGGPLRPGGQLTIGVAIEVGLFILFWIFTGIYAHKANTEFDALTQSVVAEAQKEEK